MRPEPPVSEVAQPFWEATREKRLLVQWCVHCDKPVFYPREVCPQCLEASLEWRSSVGRGTVYAVTVEHRPQVPMWRELAPYAIALVDLDDGIRMMSNIVGCPPDSVTVGMPVSVTWEELPDGRNLPLFKPTTEG